VILPLILLLLAELPPKPEGFWPVTVVGWITVIGLLSSTAYIIFQTGRWSQKLEDHKRETTKELNQFGGRVTKVEEEQVRQDGRLDHQGAQHERILGQHDILIKAIGRTEGEAVQCREDTYALGEKIDGKLEVLRKEVNATALTLATGLAEVKKELELTRESR
jgi:hypothetical protein